MDEVKRKEILEKIRKLLNLAESANKIGSEGEAIAAAAGVHRLLTEYNLSMEDVQDKEDSMDIGESEDLSYSSKYGIWKRDLLNIIAEYNYCKVLFETYRRKMTIIGEQCNVIACRNLFDFLTVTLERLAKDRFNELVKQINIPISELKSSPLFQSKEVHFKKSYIRGCMAGIIMQYREMRDSATPEERSLVITHDSFINDFIDKKYNNVRTVNRRRKTNEDVVAYRMGYNDGKDINLSPQLKESERTYLNK